LAAFVAWVGACGHESFVPGRACASGEARACYSGPAGTADVGACRAGAETCTADESGWGPCEGETGPQPETCATAADDDCDGETNEDGDGCSCVPGAVEPCYTGPIGTEGTGICAPGKRTCGASGQWGGCTNQVIPTAEDCGSPLDENCDGAVCAGPLWGALFGNTDAQAPAAITTDAGGNAIVAGTFAGAIDFGNGALVSGGGTDAFVAKLDPSGKALWSVRIGDVGAERGTSVAVDDAGDVVTAGTFTSITLDLGSESVANGGGTDGFVAKLDGTTGDPLWFVALGYDGTQVPTSVAVDADGGVLLGGHFTGDLGCYGSPAVCPSAMGGTDGFLVRFDFGGVSSSVVGFGSLGNDRVNGLALDAAGNAVVVGTFAFSGQWGDVTLSTSGVADQNLFIAKLAPNGATIWAKGLGDAGSQDASAVAIDAQGNAVVTGTTSGLLSFGGNVDDIGGDGERAFVVQLSAAGTPIWLRDFGSADGSATVLAVAVGGAGNVALAGSFSGTVSFGTGGLGAAGTTDAFLVKLDPSGGPLWAKSFGKPSFADAGQGVAFAPDGDVLLAATIQGSVDFGLGELTSAGSSDMGAAAFAP